MVYNLDEARKRDPREYKTAEDSKVESMAYTGADPWHVVLNREWNANITKVEEEMTSAEAITAGGLDWEVEVKPTYVKDKRGYVVIPNSYAIQRTSDQEVLGTVGKYYRPWQNKDAFAFFDDVIQAKLGCYTTVGALKGGRLIWIQAKVNGTASIMGDAVDCYVTLVNGHDGNLARQMFNSEVRIICWNTQRQARQNKIGETFYARHTSSIEDKVQNARDILHIVIKDFNGFAEKAKWMATHQLPAAQMPKLLYAAFAQPDSIRMEDIYNPIKVQMDKVQELVEVCRDEFPKKLHGTRWEAYQAVTRFVDWERPTRATTDKLEAAWFGAGARVKERALNFLTK
jgi:phage/plasmid-like protein (TIGR03299 family)